MLLAVLVLGGALLVAYANGANDNFKGVATLLGSGTARYRSVLAWGTFTTFLGSMTALAVGSQLVKAFTGMGLVPDATAVLPAFVVAVGLGAALTVLLATRIGVPISTTHSLMGALIGAGLVAPGHAVDFGFAARKFFLPLLVSPVLAIGLTYLLYRVLRALRARWGLTSESCVCVGEEKAVAVPATAPALHSAAASEYAVRVGDARGCTEQYNEAAVGLGAQGMLDKAHFLTSGMTSFARGLNDTPKIVGILTAAGLVGIEPRLGIVLVGVIMALGAILSARRVAETVSYRITEMNHGQGFTANLVTSLIVLLASRFGLPVSTTHVSCGSLFGIGIANRRGDVKTIRGIIVAWLITLPFAAAIAGCVFFFVQAASK